MARSSGLPETVLALLRGRANEAGIIEGMGTVAISHIVRTWTGNVPIIIGKLIDQGRLIRVTEGRGNRSATYRLPVVQQTKPSIESVPRMVTDYRWQGHGEPPQVAISLPRLRCLENSGVIK